MDSTKESRSIKLSGIEYRIEETDDQTIYILVKPVSATRFNKFYSHMAVNMLGDSIIYDHGDLDEILNHPWYILNSGYACTAGSQSLLLHRMIMGLNKGDKRHVHHKNGFANKRAAH